MVRGNGGSGYIRVDWFTPDGLSTWGDGRLTILGTDGFIEIRKNVDIGGRPGGSHLFLVDQKETRYSTATNVPLPYGERLVDDVLNRTETAMPQAHVFLAMELALKARSRPGDPPRARDDQDHPGVRPRSDRVPYLLLRDEIVVSPETRSAFRVDRLLGEGGFGQVYLSKHLGRSPLAPEVLCIKVSTRLDGWLREAHFGQLLARASSRHPDLRSLSAPCGPTARCSTAWRWNTHGTAT